MAQITHDHKTFSATTTAMTLAVAGLLFAVYPALRPYSDETALTGATAMASPAWVAAHTAAMIGFVLLPLAMLGLRAAVAGTPGRGPAAAAVVTAYFGAGLTLPYYGGETFGIKAISVEALEHQDASLLTGAETIRLDLVPATFFLVGMLLLGATGVLTAIAVRRSGRFVAWAGVPFAAAMVLFLPQFFGPSAGRVGHGLLMAAGFGILAWTLRRPQPVTS